VSEKFSSVLVLPTDLERLAVLETEIDQVLAHAPPLVEAEIVRYNMNLAIHELCVNIICHAYDGETGKFMLTLSLLDDPWRIEMSTCDNGPRRFNADGWTPPDLDDLPVHGLGVFLMRSLMDDISYTPNADCSRWRLVKRLPLADEAQDPAPGADKQPMQNSSIEATT
jgi:serine/threonine-protein kinase RsbW